MSLRTILTDVNRDMVAAWKQAFSNVGSDEVEIRHGTIFDPICDAVVCPTNSFGFMDGGLGRLVGRYFGWHVQDRLREIIEARHHGEMLVGHAAVIPTFHRDIPFVVAAPTMRVTLYLRGSANVYLATRAAYLAVAEHNDAPQHRQSPINRLAIPGLGTGTGALPVDVAAVQMRQAFEDVARGRYTPPVDWAEAQVRHAELCRIAEMVSPTDGPLPTSQL